MSQKQSFNPKDVKMYYRNMKPPTFQELVLARRKFTDSYFPPNENSLVSKDENGDYIDPVDGYYNEQQLLQVYPKRKHSWKKISELKTGKWDVFQNRIEFDDVNQGLISDCYFLSAIAALSEYPNLIIEKFRTKTYNQAGYYEMVLFIDGEWQVVFVDDYFPFLDDDFVFAKPVENELWAILLEKAWAKVNGGYSNIAYGSVYEVLLALTGFPSEFITNDPEKPLELFEKLEKSNNEGAVMGCGSFNSESGKDDSKNQGNIVFSHAYTLIDAKSLSNDGIFLCKIRNPWGRIEWNGDWGDNSSLWNPKYQKYFGYVNKDNGIFFMSIDDYVDNFEDTHICHIQYGAKIKSYTIHYEDYFKYPLVFNLRMLERGLVTFSVVTRDRRFNRNVPKNEFHPFSLLIFKYDSRFNITQFYGGNSHILHLDVHQELDEGYYAIVLYIPYEHLKLGEKFKYTFSIASKENYISRFAGKDTTFGCLETLIISYYKNFKRNEIASCEQYLLKFFNEIYNSTNLCPLMLYNNFGSTIHFMVNFKTIKGYKLIGRFKDLDCVEVDLPTGEIGIALLALTGMESAVGFECAINSTRDHGIEFDNFDPQVFLPFNFTEDMNPEDSESIKSKNYNCISKETAEEIPSLDQYNKHWKRFVEKIDDSGNNPYNKLRREFPNEFSLLEKFIKELPEERESRWMKIENSTGIYAGQVTQNDEVTGRGVFIYPNNKKYIGRFLKGNMNGYGILFNTDGKVIYQGTFVDGEINGNGIYYHSPKQYYAGCFEKNKMNGFGRFHFENGIEWIGNFTQNMKNGEGLLKADNGRYFIYKYEDDNQVDDFEMVSEEIDFFKLQEEKLNQVRDKCILGTSSLEELEKERESFLNYLSAFYQFRKNSDNTDIPSFMKIKTARSKKFRSARRPLPRDDEKLNTVEVVLLEDKDVDKAKKRRKRREPKHKLIVHE